MRRGPAFDAALGSTENLVGALVDIVAVQIDAW
eukprot:COSAG01_NODE_8001_length_2958_cov_1.785939_5_plen_33_part_00